MSELTPTEVERAAFECQNFAQAAAQLGVEKLVVIQQNHPHLHVALPLYRQAEKAGTDWSDLSVNRLVRQHHPLNREGVL
jgi:short subunit dehydrogenase-like uncharacterized protein